MSSSEYSPSLYFLYSAQNGGQSTENAQIVTFPKSNKIYLLPKSNLNYYCSYGLFESALIEWCRQYCHPNKIFLDVGAHTGTYAISLVDGCKHVYAFEPQKNTYYALCGGIAMSGQCDKITAHNFGLGNASQEGKQRLNIVSRDGGGSSIHVPPNMAILGGEEIEIRVLDKILSEKEKSQIGFIKMDVEDNELFVLEGATNTIMASDYPTILFESNHDNLPLFRHISILGYEIIPISGVSNMFLAVYPHNKISQEL